MTAGRIVRLADYRRPARAPAAARALAVGDQVELPSGYQARIEAIRGNRLSCRLIACGLTTIAFPREVKRIGAAVPSRPQPAPET